MKRLFCNGLARTAERRNALWRGLLALTLVALLTGLGARVAWADGEAPPPDRPKHNDGGESSEEDKADQVGPQSPEAQKLDEGRQALDEVRDSLTQDTGASKDFNGAISRLDSLLEKANDNVDSLTTALSLLGGAELDSVKQQLDDAKAFKANIESLRAQAVRGLAAKQAAPPPPAPQAFNFEKDTTFKEGKLKITFSPESQIYRSKLRAAEGFQTGQDLRYRYGTDAEGNHYNVYSDGTVYKLVNNRMVPFSP